jgi:predicted RNase H-like nuclease
MRVVGVDGCRGGGWIAVTYDTESGTLTPQFHPFFRGVLVANRDAAVVAVDIPIGLSEGEPRRRCDVEARAALGQPRQSSVFTPPDPRALDEVTYEDMLTLSFALTDRGISIQAFGIAPRIREVNRLMTPQLQGHVVEIHPEVCFWAAAGERSMTYRKKTREGYEERRAILAQALGCTIWSRGEASKIVPPAKPHDVLDATVAAWTAHREAEGRAGRLPIYPETDRRGLRMEMVF